MTPEQIAHQVREDIEEAERDVGHALDNEAIENIVYENVRAHIDTLTAAVPSVERLAEAMHGAYERDPSVKRIEWSDLSDAEKGMWKRHATAVLAILRGTPPPTPTYAEVERLDRPGNRADGRRDHR